MENNGQQKVSNLINKPHCYYSENTRPKHGDITSSCQAIKINDKSNNSKCLTTSFKKEKKLKKKPTTELVVNLKYDEEVPAYCKYSSKKKSQKFSFAGLDICDQSRFKFLFDNYSDMNFSGKVEWDEVFEVVYSPVENLACPICIDKEMLVPIITRCGHIFCWPCFKSYENYTKGDMICPFCKEYIEPSLVRFCKINSCSQYNAGDEITFNLIMRDRRSLSLYNTNLDPTLE